MLLEAIEGWEWDVPSGLRIEQVNRASIKWKKGGFSHFCEAAWYAVMAAIYHQQPRRGVSDGDFKRALRNLTPSLGAELEGIYDW